MDNYQNQQSYGRKEQYNIQDERVGNIGPMDTAMLQAWFDSGLVDGNALALEVGSIQSKPVSQILSEKPIQGAPPSDWFLWTDNKSPFNNMVNKVNKSFITRQSLSEHKKNPTPITGLQDFEQFMEGPIPKDQAPMFISRINKLAQPFVIWVFKTFRDLGSTANDDEILKLILNSDPKTSRKFFYQKLPSEQFASKFFSMYAQWRLYIPVYIDQTSN